MSNNKYEFVQASVEDNKNGTVTVTAKVPACNPRKNIPMIRYDADDAFAFAQKVFGENLGAMVGSNTVLENRRYPDRLHGEWVFELNKPSSTTTSKPKTATRRRRTRRTTKKSTAQ